MEITLARSKAGHDKGRIYVIAKTEGENVFLTDGKRRLLDNPKKKRSRHIQIIKNLSENVKDFIKDIDRPTDSEIKKIIRIYETELAGKEC